MKPTIKPIIAGMLLAASALGASAETQLLAFPGAEGFGRYTQGARSVDNPQVYHVTNLNDSGTGSFRDAVSGTGRVIVFDVSGIINLQSALVVKGNNTILGQTAPGEGVQIYGDRVSFSNASNLIVRYIRFRMGASGTSGADACGVANGTDMIYDHVTALWGLDECFSVNWDNKNDRPARITIQNSIIGQGLQSHSCGGLIQTIGGVTLYRNLYIENKTRNPKVKGLNQYVNNVVYNWGNGGCYIMSDSEGDSWADIENNYFINGPWNNATDAFVRGIKTFRYYGVGNYWDDNKDGVLDGHLMTVDEMNGSQNGTEPYSTYFASLADLNADITSYNTTATEAVAEIPAIVDNMTAEEALHWIEQYVGPSLPVRDEVDQYLIDELMSYGTAGTVNGISSEKQLSHKGTGVISGGPLLTDTDGDGIPDEWEIANGLNPNDASDAVAIAANGYLNIENYANSITGPMPYIKKPINLAVTKQEKNSLSISWELNKNTEKGFVIELQKYGETFAEAATAPAGTTAYTLTGLDKDTQYSVRVRATDGQGLYSDYTDIVVTETIDDPSAPKLSTDPFPANGGREGIAAGLTLTWENATKTYDGAVYYTVMLGESAESLAAVAENITAKQWVSSGLEANKTYYWRVDAKNDVGSTQGDVWSFTTTEGGVLFYADFNTLPEEYGAKYASITSNTNIINAANASVTFNGMKIGSGENSIRIVAMAESNNSTSSSSDYGPATSDDEGASNRCIQFVTTSAGGYVTTPTVSGPCVVTIYAGNPDKSSKTIKLNTIVNGEETLATDMTLGAAKRMYKFTYTYTGGGTVAFKIDANGKKVNINDILIESYVSNNSDDPVMLTSGSLDNDITYSDGSLTLGFNQDIAINGTPKIGGTHYRENISVAATGTKLSISYEALDVNSEYTITFPSGCLTSLDGSRSYTATVTLNTCDFPELKAEGENHYGKAATTLPLTFVPFNEVAPFATVGSLVQEQQNDYPHWVQASGSISAEEAVMTSTSDKLMCYFEPASAALGLDIEYVGTGKPRLKVLESRNCDKDPGWRTVVVLEPEDFPFHNEIVLNPESNFIKLMPVTIGGELHVKALALADSQGNFTSDYQPGGFISGLNNVIADSDINVTVSGNTVKVSGLAADATVRVYDLAGRLVVATKADTFSLASGLYIVSVDGHSAVKVML